MDRSFRELVEAAPDAMLEVDQAGIIGLANEEAERVFGKPREQLIGGKIGDLIPERYSASGFDGYVSKPISISDVRHQVEQLLGGNEDGDGA